MSFNSVISARPNLPLNCVAVVLFGLEFLILAFQGLFSRDIWPTVMYCMATVLEMIGYGFRISLHSSFNLSSFITQNVFLALAPTLISAALYIHFAKYVVAHSQQTFFRHTGRAFVREYVLVELGARILQIVGASMMPKSANLYESGRWLLCAGMALQLAVILVFLYFAGIKVSQVQNDPSAWEYEFREIRSRSVFKEIPIVIAISAVFIIIRLIYRVVMLATDPTGKLAGERYFLPLDGLMIVLSLVPLCVFYPGRAVGSVKLEKEPDYRHQAYKSEDEGPMIID